jgi:D-aminoacyl-tRNA deacylase
VSIPVRDGPGAASVIAFLQRVSAARVAVAAETVGEIGAGLLVFLGVARGDREAEAMRLAERVLEYRVFADAGDRMNLSLLAVGGELLVVPQFTLCADTKKGSRPSFTPAAAPELGEALYERFVAETRTRARRVATGRFGAHMQVSLTNDGPVSFWLEVPPAAT